MIGHFTLLRLMGSADPFRSIFNKDSGGAQAPDYTPIAQSNAEAAKYAKEAATDDLNFRKQVYADSKPWQDELYGKASQIADQQIGLADTTAQRSDQQWQDYNNTYRPTEKVSAMDSYGARYLNDEDNAGLSNLINGGEVAGGKVSRPNEMDSTAYTALQQKIKAGGGASLSDGEVAELAGLMGKTAPTDPSKQPTTDPNAIPWYVDPESGSYIGGGVIGALQRQGAAGKQADATAKYQSDLDEYNTGKTRMEELLKKQAAGPGAYQLTDEDKAVLAKYGTDKAAYDKGLADYNNEQDNLRTIGLSSLARKAEGAAADQAETRADADNASAFAQASRSLSRFGGDTSKMASNAVGLANAQALNRVGAGNAARESAADKLTALRSGTVATGRNQVNTAGQNVGLSTNAGSSAVQNQNTGFMSGLPYAQYQSGGTQSMLGAAQIQQQGGLGLGSLMNQGYGIGVQQNAAAGQGTGAIIGAGASIAAAFI